MLTKILPLASDPSHGDFGGVRRLTHIHIASVVVQVVDAVWNRFPQGILIKVMIVNRFGFLAPTPPSILESADELFFLGIDTDHRPSVAQEKLFLGFDILKLPVPIRML